MASRVSGARFYLRTRDFAPRDLEILEGVSTIGRLPGETFSFPHPTLSKRHACVRREGDVITLTDLKSSCGIYVNGRRIGPQHPLKPGDIISLGQITLELVALDESKTKPP